MGHTFRILARITVSITVVALLAGLFGFLWLRKSVQPMSGEMAIAGLSAEATVVRDANAIPHISGATNADVFAALGYTHAQERLWQMEMFRRTTQGRLSEIFGKRALKADKYFRTIDLHGLASQSVAYLEPEVRAALEAYAKGVNAFINREKSWLEPRFPPEFIFKWYQPEPWTPSDSLATMKLLQLKLSKNLGDEHQRMSLTRRGFTPAEIVDMKPWVPGDRPPALADLREIYPFPKTAAEPEQQPIQTGFLPAMGTWASNNWVVSGDRSVTGKPLLANDPHLELTAPSIWYLAHLVLPDGDKGPINVIGAGVPGTPMIILGRNDKIAWGFTNAGADVQDLFIEKLDPSDPTKYITPTGLRAFDVERVTIKVAGGDDYILERRHTRHGPVLPADSRYARDNVPDGHVAALSWTALTPRDKSIQAGFGAAQAQNWDEFSDSMRSVLGPMQSIVVADADASIGLIAPALVPVRKPGNDLRGRAPAPGWDPAYDWSGWIRFEDLPQIKNPASGAIATSNGKIVGPEYDQFLTYDWDRPHRTRRSVALLNGRAIHSLESFMAIQQDTHSQALRDTVTLMSDILGDRASRSSATIAAIGLLDRWDGAMDRNGNAPLIAAAWVRATQKRLLQDDLGEDFPTFWSTRADRLTNMLNGTARARDWCDDRTTEPVETCQTILEMSLKATLAELSDKYGDNPDRWQWGEAHMARNKHPVLGNLPVIGSFFNVDIPSSGGSYTLNRGDMNFANEADPYANVHAASYRAIYDLSMPDRSVFIHTTGQSGNPFSPHYRDFAERWATGEYITMTTKPEEYSAGALGTFRLYPADAGSTLQ